MIRMVVAVGNIPSYLNPIPLMPNKVQTIALQGLKKISDSFLQLQGPILTRSAKIFLPHKPLAFSIQLSKSILRTLLFSFVISSSFSYMTDEGISPYLMGTLIGGAVNLYLDATVVNLELRHYPKKILDFLAAYETYRAHNFYFINRTQTFPIHLLYEQNEMDQFLELKEVQEFFGENGCRFLKLLPALPPKQGLLLLSLYHSNQSLFINLINIFSEYRQTEGAVGRTHLKQIFISLCCPQLDALCKEPLGAIFDSGIIDWLEAAIKDPKSDEAWAPFDVEMDKIETPLRCLKDLVSEELDFTELWATCRKKVREKGVFQFLPMQKSDFEKMFKEHMKREEKQELCLEEKDVKLLPFLLSHTPFETRKFLGYPEGITEKRLAQLDEKLQQLTEEQQIELCKKVEGLENSFEGDDEMEREIDSILKMLQNFN